MYLKPITRLKPLGGLNGGIHFAHSRIMEQSATTITSLHHIMTTSQVSARYISQIGLQNASISRCSRTLFFPKFIGSQILHSRNLAVDARGSQNTAQSNITSDSIIKPDDPQANLVWIDLEMTGLDIDKDTILEIAVIITDSDLNIVFEGPEIVIHHPETVLTSMNEWSTKNHQMTGLVNEVRKSSISMENAEQIVIDSISPHITRGRSLLAGNSVHTDRKFLNKHMPKLLGMMHHRIIDVTSIRELCKRWFNQELMKMPDKRIQHRALDDIRQSIEELKYYKKAVFKPVETTQNE